MQATKPIEQTIDDDVADNVQATMPIEQIIDDDVVDNVQATKPMEQIVDDDVADSVQATMQIEQIVNDDAVDNVQPALTIEQTIQNVEHVQSHNEENVVTITINDDDEMNDEIRHLIDSLIESIRDISEVQSIETGL